MYYYGYPTRHQLAGIHPNSTGLYPFSLFPSEPNPDLYGKANKLLKQLKSCKKMTLI